MLIYLEIKSKIEMKIKMNHLLKVYLMKIKMNHPNPKVNSMIIKFEYLEKILLELIKIIVI